MARRFDDDDDDDMASGRGRQRERDLARARQRSRKSDRPAPAPVARPPVITGQLRRGQPGKIVSIDMGRRTGFAALDAGPCFFFSDRLEGLEFSEALIGQPVEVDASPSTRRAGEWFAIRVAPAAQVAEQQAAGAP